MESRCEHAKRGFLKLQEEISALPIETSVYDLFVKIESSLAFQQLKDVLNICLTLTETEVENLFQPLIKLFKARWQGIRKTNACYSHAPLLRANLAYQKTSVFAAVYFLKHAFELLMPTVKWNDFFIINGTSIGLHEFILDDYEYPLLVLNTLFLAQNQNNQTTNVSRVFYKLVNGMLEELQSLEIIRLSNHSALVLEYYLKFNAHALDDNENVSWKNKLEEAYNNFSFHVTSSYEHEGDLLLRSYIFSQIKTMEDLVDLMRLHITDKSDWPEFFRRTPSEELCRILLGMTINPNAPLSEKDLLDQAKVELNKKVVAFKTTVLNPDLVYEESWVRAYIYCHRELYNRARDSEPESRTTIGYCASFLLRGSRTGFFSKTEKLNSSDVFGQFLLSNHPLSDLEGYLKKENLYDTHWEPLTTQPCKGFSTLVTLVEITRQVKIKINEEKQSQIKLGSSPSE